MNWVVCVKNAGHETSLEAPELYNVQDDPKAASAGMLRVVDESQESYLYAKAMFTPIAIQNALEGQLLAA